MVPPLNGTEPKTNGGSLREDVRRCVSAQVEFTTPQLPVHYLEPVWTLPTFSTTLLTRCQFHILPGANIDKLAPVDKSFEKLKVFCLLV